MDASGRNRAAIIGRSAESRALIHLERAGLVLLERNFRCRSGEIDLIMQERDTVVFVEVRMRRESRFGTALESIDARKLQRIRSAAEFWLRRCGRNHRARVDVVTLDGADCGTASIAWIRGIDA